MNPGENPFLLAAKDRLSQWIALRSELSTMPEKDALVSVARYWASAPFQPKSRPCDPSSWPSAWEMLHHGSWCRNSIASGIEATLRLAGWQTERLSIIAIREADGSEFSVTQIDGGPVLNYVWGRVTDGLGSSSRIVATWLWSGRGYVPSLGGTPTT
jgi:hypothetical protein